MIELIPKAKACDVRVLIILAQIKSVYPPGYSIIKFELGEAYGRGLRESDVSGIEIGDVLFWVKRLLP